MGKFYKLKTFFRGFGGHDIIKAIFIRRLNYAEQNGCLKILFGRFLGKVGVGGGIVAPPPLMFLVI